MEVERRCVDVSNLELRIHKNKTTLEGYAIRYDSLSEDLGFRERIATGAFSKNLRSDPDVRALVEHSPEKIIGRTRAGTLQLIEDERGVRVSIDPPDTQVGRDVVESVKRGDLSAMSFGFRAVNDSWENVDGEAVRTIHEGELFDVSIVSFPAYPDTSIAARSMDAWRKESKQMAEVKAPTTETDVSKVENEIDTTPTERRSVPAEPVQTETREVFHNPSEWRDCKTGRTVRVLKPGDTFESENRSNELSIGRAIRAMIVGDWSDALAEQRALSTTANPTAGILIPNPLAARVIDKARAASRLVQAGASTVAMDASTLTIARVSTDPTIEMHAENTAFTGSDVSFDAISMTAFTLGTVVKMSRELAADAPNSVALIEDTLARALATKIDFYGLQGTGSQQPLGLVNFTGTNTDAVGGSVDYNNILTGIMECEIDNHTPNAYLMSPTNADVLRKLLINAEANHYAAAPAAVQALRGFSTNNMPNGTMVVGDFSQFIIGLRQSPVIEVSTDAGGAFEEHAVYIKVTWRGAFNAEHMDAFTLLTGIV